MSPILVNNHYEALGVMKLLCNMIEWCWVGWDCSIQRDLRRTLASSLPVIPPGCSQGSAFHTAQDSQKPLFLLKIEATVSSSLQERFNSIKDTYFDVSFLNSCIKKGSSGIQAPNSFTVKAWRLNLGVSLFHLWSPVSFAMMLTGHLTVCCSCKKARGGRRDDSVHVDRHCTKRPMPSERQVSSTFFS